MNNQLIEILERLTKVETRLTEALENHLPHLDMKMNHLGAKLDKVMFWVFTTLFGFALSVIGGLLLFILK